MIQNKYRPYAKPARNELYVNIKEMILKVFSINIDTNEHHFYYHFNYSKDSPNKVLNYSTGKMTGRPEHISLHKDGKGFLKYYDNPRPYPIGNFSNQSFIPNRSHTLTPLLIHSIFEHENIYLLPTAKEVYNDNNLQIFYSQFIPTNKSFTLIIFLSPANRTLEEVLMHDLTKNKLKINDFARQACRILVWDQWAIDCIITEWVLPLPEISPIYQAFSCANLDLAFSNLIPPKIDDIRYDTETEKMRIISIQEFNELLIK